jgi:hypothetical protein
VLNLNVTTVINTVSSSNRRAAKGKGMFLYLMIDRNIVDFLKRPGAAANYCAKLDCYNSD